MTADAERTSPHDLVLTRTVPVPRAVIWKAWTEPDHLKKWFTPSPWRTTGCQIDLRPGGVFGTVMEGPNGERNEGAGCFLVVEPPSRLVWTSALGPGFRPNDGPMPFTCILAFDEADGGTRYEARVLHKDAEDAKRHADMGFHQGWGAALDQLVAVAPSIR